jgi:hypothetical protein
MDADYSIELGPTAPALEIPWNDPEGKLQFFDLHTNPSAIEHIPEALQFPALREFLVKLNSDQSKWLSAKCDVWTEAVEAADNLYGAVCSQNCYIDIALAKPTEFLRRSLGTNEKLARELARQLKKHDGLEASAEIVVRRCYFHRGCELNESDEGYSLTLFLTGYGASASEAADRWETALQFTAECLFKLHPHATLRTQLE